MNKKMLVILMSMVLLFSSGLTAFAGTPFPYSFDFSQTKDVTVGSGTFKAPKIGLVEGSGWSLGDSGLEFLTGNTVTGLTKYNFDSSTYTDPDNVTYYLMQPGGGDKGANINLVEITPDQLEGKDKIRVSIDMGFTYRPSGVFAGIVGYYNGTAGSNRTAYYGLQLGFGRANVNSGRMVAFQNSAFQKVAAYYGENTGATQRYDLIYDVQNATMAMYQGPILIYSGGIPKYVGTSTDNNGYFEGPLTSIILKAQMRTATATNKFYLDHLEIADFSEQDTKYEMGFNVPTGTVSKETTTSYPASGTFNAEARIRNATDQSISGMLAVAIYDDEGKLKGVRMDKGETPAATEENPYPSKLYTVKVENEPNCTARAFLWDSETLSPFRDDIDLQ